jgi:hypothetical protein
MDWRQVPSRIPDPTTTAISDSAPLIHYRLSPIVTFDANETSTNPPGVPSAS